MRRVKVFIPMTLDNYIATEQGNLNWLNHIDAFDDFGYKRLYNTIDTVVLGRQTMEWLMDIPNMSFPYSDKACYVMSQTPQPPAQNVTWIQQDVAAFLQQLKAQSGQDIWLVGGGQIIRSAFDAHVVDEVIVVLAPILLGKGIPLFTGILNTQHLQLRQVEAFGQFVEIRYDVVPI